MIPTLITGALGLAGGIAGAFGANAQARKAAEQQQRRDQFNNALFQRQYYQDAINRADTQNFLRTLRNNMRETVEQQNNTAVITGQTPEAVAATKEANARAYADAIANIDATNATRRDQALTQHQAAQNQSFNDWIKLYNQQAANWQNFASQAFGIGAKAIGNYGNNTSATNIATTDPLTPPAINPLATPSAPQVPTTVTIPRLN